MPLNNLPDKIILHGASFQAHVGCTDAERVKPQEIILDVEIERSITKAAATDSLADTINYEEIHSLIKNYVQHNQHQLIETFAENIANLLLQESNIQHVHLILKKPQALAHKDVKYCAIEITRSK